MYRSQAAASDAAQQAIRAEKPALLPLPRQGQARDGRLLQKAAEPLVDRQQPLDLGAQRVISRARRGQERRPPGRLDFEGRGEQAIHLAPALGSLHQARLSTGWSWSYSQARARRHSLPTVLGDTPRCSAVSSSVRPAKNLSSTTAALRGSRQPRLVSASS